MGALPGNPAALADRAATYVSSAALIAQAAEELRSIAFNSEANSLAAVRAQGTEVAGDLDKAHSRYSGTAHALKDYAVQLQAAHRRADSAVQAATYARAQSNTADQAVQNLEYRVRALENADVPAGTIQATQQQLWDARRTAYAADQAETAAASELAGAQADMEAAAEAAIRRIENAIADTNEGFWDRVRKIVEDIGGFFAAIGQWVGEFLDDLYHALLRVLATVIAVLGAVLILVLVYALLAAIPIIGPLIAAVVTGILAGFLLASVLSDVLKPTPTVSSDRDTIIKNPTAHELHGGQPEGLQDALLETRLVDALGTDPNTGSVDSTVISVTKVVDADGVVRWRVALPSTQEWLSRFGDQGGTNDLDSNLALMLTPALQSQYERAVIEAMRQAGVGADDPVMLVGFSQGGIMAGNLAAYNNEYNWSSVVVSGAPIDNMPIPSSVNVVSVQHSGDPVHHIDTIMTLGAAGYAPQQDNWTTIQATSPGASEGVHGIHNAAYYSATLAANIDRVPPETQAEMSRFFVGDENTYGTQQTYYGWSE